MRGVLIPTIALFSSFGPVIALAALGSTLQNTFAAGNRVLDILEETPAVEEVDGKPEITFTGAAAEHVTLPMEAKIFCQTYRCKSRRTVLSALWDAAEAASHFAQAAMRFWDVQQEM